MSPETHNKKTKLYISVFCLLISCFCFICMWLDWFQFKLNCVLSYLLLFDPVDTKVMFTCVFMILWFMFCVAQKFLLIILLKFNNLQKITNKYKLKQGVCTENWQAAHCVNEIILGKKNMFTFAVNRVKRARWP